LIFDILIAVHSLKLSLSILCRVHVFCFRNLMAKEDWKKLGYADAEESRTAAQK